ncbi:MAG: ATP-binding cassette domain-containing protein [Treponema sp.]|jgi:simple sugar transport system ATP-binding protein|nr:ATP-binding cassette domain-containing protein [Treponema sp.]
MVELRNIQKYFPSNGVAALSGADFTLREGEIHALVGENGAGKSTLMHIMAGFVKPGGNFHPGLKRGCGTISVDGKDCVFNSPAQALNAGIGMVRQHPHLVPSFTVWENCILGSMKNPFVFMNQKAAAARAAFQNEKWNFRLPLEKYAKELTVSEEQKISILALLLRDVRYLIFDEPTAVLGDDESRNLFGIFGRLREEGKAVAIISHKLEEMARVADRVTVLRRGKTAAVLDSARLRETGADTLGELIFGPEESRVQARVKPSVIRGADAPALKLGGFTVRVPGRPLVRGIDLVLPRGMILGIAGVRDSGLETLELAVAGFLPFGGIFEINGKTQEKNSVESFRRLGGAYLGTRGEGIALPVEKQLIIHAHRRLQTHGFLKKRLLAKWTALIMKYAQAPEHLYRAPGTAFSGGQMQRLLLMREYAEDTPLLVLAEPGRGLDRRFRKKLALALKERAEKGAGILVFSAGCDELLEFADEVMVLRDGRLSPPISLYEGDPRGSIKKAMVGGE